MAECRQYSLLPKLHRWGMARAAFDVDDAFHRQSETGRIRQNGWPHNSVLTSRIQMKYPAEWAGSSSETNDGDSDSNARMRHGRRMQSFNPAEPGKILRVERQDSPHFVDAHDRNEMSVMHLDSRDGIIHD
jgi:hypothetical protein